MAAGEVGRLASRGVRLLMLATLGRVLVILEAVLDSRLPPPYLLPLCWLDRLVRVRDRVRARARAREG